RVASVPAAVGPAAHAPAEGAVRLAGGSVEGQRPLGPEAPQRVFGRQSASIEAELVIRASGNGVVSLPRIEGPFEDPKRPHELGKDEMRISVTVAMEVAALVDRNTTDRELDVLPFASVEATQE